MRVVTLITNFMLTIIPPSSYFYWINNHNNMQKVLVITHNIRKIDMTATVKKQFRLHFFWDS